MAKLDEARATAIAREYLQKQIHQFEDAFKGGVGNAELIQEELAKRVWRAKKDHRGSLDGKVSSGAKDRAEDVLMEAGEPRPEWDSQEFEDFTRKIIQAHIEDARIATARFDRDYANVAIQNPLFSGLDVGLVRHPMVQVISPTNTPTASGAGPIAGLMTIVEAKDKYIKANEKQWNSGKTYDEKVRTLLWFIEYMGTKGMLAQISDADVRGFRDTLVKVPARMNNVPKLLKLPFMKLIEVHESYPRIGAGTAQKYLSHVKVFLAWCVDEAYLNNMPGSTIKVTGNKDVKKRPPFTDNEIDTLLTSPLYAGHGSKQHFPGNTITKDGLYWGPLIGLLTGMRSGEVMQITKEDVRRTKAGTYYFDLTGAETGSIKMRLKTESSARQVPIHKYLIALGLVDYVKALPDGARLLHDIALGPKDDIARYLGKAFIAYLKKVGIQGKSFHCFRHTMRNMLSSAEAQDSHVKAILGHEQDSTSFGSYGGAIAVDTLGKTVNKIKVSTLDKANFPGKA